VNVSKSNDLDSSSCYSSARFKLTCIDDVDKKAELSQRWLRDAPYMGALTAHSYFLMGFCTDWAYECAYKIWSS